MKGSKPITKEIRALSRRIGQHLHERRRSLRMSLRKLARLTGLPEWRLDELFRVSRALRYASLADML